MGSLEDALFSGIIDDWDYVILTHSPSRRLKFTGRKPFHLDQMDEESCLKKFRFKKEDLPKLALLLKFPKTIRLENRAKVGGVEALCILLRRFASKGRGHDLVEIFGREESVINRIFNWSLNHIYENFSHCVQTLERPWITKATLDHLAAKSVEKGSTFAHCIGYLDGTLDRISRPQGGYQLQKMVFCYKKFHALKFQGLSAVNGIILLLEGPFVGRMHDANICKASKLSERLRKLNEDLGIPICDRYMVYADKAYAMGLFIVPAFKNVPLGSPEAQLNDRMKSLRISVEWAFGKIGQLFSLTRDGDAKKIQLQPVAKYLPVAAIMTNLHTCLYGGLTSNYFDCIPPTCEEYLAE